MFIDIHAHLNDERLIEDVENVILRATEQNVGKIVCVGSDYEASVLAVKLADKYKNVYATVGVHPYDCFFFDKKMEDLILLASKNKKVIAIGEIGLDFNDVEHQILEAKEKNPNLNLTKEIFIEKQKEIFLKQMQLANQVNLPIMIHMRDATKDTLNLLENTEEGKLAMKNGGIFHCYNGSLETTKRIFDLGFYISIGGTITFKNSKMVEVLKAIGIEKVMLETDCPYLSPEPFRGKTNEPKNIPLIAEKIASIINQPVEYVEEVTTNNCYKVFNNLKD
jgi:TatD DNase family protein